MRRLARLGSGISLLVALGLTAGQPDAAGAVSFVINNGLAPPNPANVIDDAAYPLDAFHIRNVGCPPGWPAVDPDDPCPSPGAPTQAALVDGGELGVLYTRETSALTISGGKVNTMVMGYDSSTITMTGGTVWGEVVLRHSSSFTITAGILEYSDLIAIDSSAVTISGGIMESLSAEDDSTVTIVGSDFEVGGVPVPYGGLSASDGYLTGELLSGDPLDIFFNRLPDATITLIPELTCGNGLVEGPEQCDDGGTAPGDGCDATCQIETDWICAGEPSVCTEHSLPTLSPWFQLALVAGLLGAGLGVWRRRTE